MFVTDSSWTEKVIIPLFSWKNPTFAIYTWSGLLRSSNVDITILNKLKNEFINCGSHLKELSSVKHDYIQIVLRMSLWKNPVCSKKDIKTIFSNLSAVDLSIVIRELNMFLSSEKDLIKSKWKYQLRPFFVEIFPKDKKMVSYSEFSRELSSLLIKLGDDFDDGFKLLENSLIKTIDLDYIFFQLKESAICKKYPDQSLDFLSKITSKPKDPYLHLEDCLKQISEAKKTLKNSPKYKLLYSYSI